MTFEKWWKENSKLISDYIKKGSWTGIRNFLHATWNDGYNHGAKNVQQKNSVDCSECAICGGHLEGTLECVDCGRREYR